MVAGIAQSMRKSFHALCGYVLNVRACETISGEKAMPINIIRHSASHSRFPTSYQRISSLCGERMITELCAVGDVSTKENAVEMLDKCILLNTYLKNYFLPMKYVESFNILFSGCEGGGDVCDFVSNNHRKGIFFNGLGTSICLNPGNYAINELFIDEFVKEKIGAKEEKPRKQAYPIYCFLESECYVYDIAREAWPHFSCASPRRPFGRPHAC